MVGRHKASGEVLGAGEHRQQRERQDSAVKDTNRGGAEVIEMKGGDDNERERDGGGEDGAES